LHIPLNVITAYRIENNIGAAPGSLLDDFHKIFLIVIDRPQRTQTFTYTTALIGTRRRIDSCAGDTRHLNGNGTDPTAATVNQECFAYAQRAALINVTPDSKQRFRQGR